jgi:hypothetical protein
MKIAVVLVLVVAGLLFATGAGFAFAKPKPKQPSNPQKDAKSHDRSPFEDFLASLSLPTKASSPLQKSVYKAGDPEETVGKADALRTVKLRLITKEACDLEIRYLDNAPHDSDLGDQTAHLPRHADEGKGGDRKETSIVILKTGGRVTFGPCAVHKTGACPGRYEVVK